MRIRDDSELGHHCMECLSQLATLNGAIFADDAARVSYLSVFITTFLNLFHE